MLIFVVILDCILVRFSLLADMVAVFDFKLFLIKCVQRCSCRHSSVFRKKLLFKKRRSFGLNFGEVFS